MATTETEDNNGKINTAVTLGAVGTGLGILSALNGNNGGGILSGLFGGNNNTMTNAAGMAYVDQLQAKIAEMNAEKYSNNVALEVYKAARTQDALLTTKFENLASEISEAKIREATLRGEIATNNATIQGQIANVANTANNGISVLSANLACLQNTVNGITATYVPSAKVTPVPMPALNAWVSPSSTTTATTTSSTSST